MSFSAPAQTSAASDGHSAPTPMSNAAGTWEKHFFDLEQAFYGALGELPALVGEPHHCQGSQS